MDKNKEIEKIITENPVLSAVQKLLNQQTTKGIEKYGQSVQFDDLSVVEWIDHASEEITDLLVYLQAAKLKILAMQKAAGDRNG